MNVEIASAWPRAESLQGCRGGPRGEVGVSRQLFPNGALRVVADTDNLIALAKLYGVSLDELLYVDESIEDDVAFEAADRAEVRGASRVVVAEASEETASPEGGGVGDACDAETAEGVDFEKEGRGKVPFGPVAFTWTTARIMCTCPGPRACTWSTATAKRCTSVGTACASTRRILRRQSISSRVTNPFGVSPGDFDADRAKKWLKFPFWALVIVATSPSGWLSGIWGPTLFLLFLIPTYYIVGAAVASRRHRSHAVRAVSYWCDRLVPLDDLRRCSLAWPRLGHLPHDSARGSHHRSTLQMVERPQRQRCQGDVA